MSDRSFPRPASLVFFSVFLLISLHLTSAAEGASIGPEKLARRIHELVNQERAKKKLALLSWSPDLSAIARQHSQDMVDRKFFDHLNPEGEGPTERGKKAGFVCRRDAGNYIVEGLAENLFQNHLYRKIHTLIVDGRKKTIKDPKTLDEIAESTVSGWMASRGHRKNILNEDCRATGIGIVFAEDGQIYITQLFC